MFDSLVSAAAAARTPAQRVRAFARVENAACAQRLAGMYAMLSAAYAESGSAERDQWRFDNWAAVCARIGAAHEVTSGVASGLLMDAETLAERLPKVAAVFATGRISYRLVHLICTRTAVVKGAQVLAELDAELAAVFAEPAAMSVLLAQMTVDALVARLDPYAVRRATTHARRKRVTVSTDDGDGEAHVDAVLDVLDGKAFDERVDALARTVCPRDPRELDARRSAAMGAMGYGWDRLPCLCETDDCPAAAIPAVGGIFIHVVADRDTLDGADTAHRPDPTPPTGPEPPTDPDPTDTDVHPADRDDPHPDNPHRDHGVEHHDDGEHGYADGTAGYDEAEASDAASYAELGHDTAASSAADTGARRAPVGDLTAQRRALCQPAPPMLPRPWWTYTLNQLCTALHTDPGQYCPAAPAVILGGAVVPAPVLAHAARYATIRDLVHPGQAPPKPRYRPSRRLARFIRCRDLTCRYPGCTKPATVCDLDHVIAHPQGPTQAANMACFCREHHLLKTFWPGWSVQLHPDGTVVWTEPDGHRTTTHPGSRLLFPTLCQPAAPHHVTATPPATPITGQTMPKRSITRAHARRQRLDDERQRNIQWARQHLGDQNPPF